MLAEEIRERGFAVIPGLLDAPYTRALRAEIAAALARPADPARDAENLRNPTRTASSILEIDWRPLLHKAMTPAVRIANDELLGADPRVVLQHSRIRRQFAPTNRPAEHVAHPWHSDAGVGYAPGRVLTLWITLDDCGDDAPSLEFYARAAPPPMPGEHDDGRFTSCYGTADRTVVKVSAGDAVLFPSTTFHRTHLAPPMRRDRISIDVRTAAGGDVPVNMQGCETVPLSAL